MLNKISQCEEATHSIIPTICHTGKNRSMEEGKRSVIARWWEEERGTWEHRNFTEMKIICVTL